MKAEEIKALESHFQTDNEHWNGFAFEMLCEVLQKGNFEEAGKPLQLFDKASKIFTEHHETPLKAVHLFAVEVDQANLYPAQKFFVYEWVCKYLSNSEFPGIDLSEIEQLLNSQTDRLRNDKPPTQYNKPLTGSIRDTLKEFVLTEIEKLPETMKQLAPEQRLNVVCKLIPYVLPKVESVTHKLGEPDEPKQSNWGI